MGFGSLLRKGAGLVKSVSKIPGVGMIPIVGNVVSAAGLAASAYGAYSALKGTPAMGGVAGGMPALPPPGSTGGGILPRGPGGAIQMPWSDPRESTAAGGSVALDDRYLKPMFRAPRGYVVMWDGGGRGMGRPFPVLRSWAVKNRYANGSRIFDPASKPPISVGEWNALKKADRVIKKLKTVNKRAMAVANFGSHRRAAPRLQVLEAPGRKVIGRKAA